MVRDQAGALREGMRRRGILEAMGPLIERAERVEGEGRAKMGGVEERRPARNSASQEVARRKKAGEPAGELVASTRALGDEIARLEGERASAESELDAILLELPNLTLDDVPEGGEAANAVVRSWGTPRAESGVRPHWEIGEALGILDLARGAKVAGSGFIVFRGLRAPPPPPPPQFLLL